MEFKGLLEESVRIHGHLCAGQVLGVRLAMYGLSLIGIADPKGADRKKLIVFVEIDRCATDAIQSVSGCSLGKRSMRFYDYGKMAATFYNLETQKAMRIIAREDSKEVAKALFPQIEDKYTAQLEAYKVMPDSGLFDIMEVAVTIPPEDMPGRPFKRVQCEKCHEFVQDNRDIEIDGRIICRSCSLDGYRPLGYYKKI